MAKLGERVLVQRCGRDLEHEIAPPTWGRVVRLLVRDDSFWVELDERRQEAAHPFPPDDATRATHVLTWDEGCAPKGRPVNPDPTDEDGGACMMYEHGMALERVPTVRWHECEPETREFWRACYRFANSRGVAKGRAQRDELTKRLLALTARVCARETNPDLIEIARSLEAMLSEEEP